MLKRCFLSLFALWLPLVSYAVEDDAVLGSAQDIRITAADVRKELSLVPSALIRGVLSDPQKHLALIDGMIRLEIYAREAKAQGVPDDPQVLARIEKSRKQILADELRNRVIRSIVSPDFTNLAREEYLSRKSEFTVPEQVRVRHILIKATDEKQKSDAAERLFQIKERVRRGESFEAIAREYSQDTGSAPEGGDLGFFGRGKMVEPFERAAFALREPGELSDIVETQFGLHLIQLVERRDAREREFEEVKDIIIARIDSDYRKKMIESWEREMNERAASSIDYESLRELFAEELKRLN